MSFVITEPYQFIAGLDGEALDGGYIYYGVPNMDPIQNPKSVYSDEAMTIPMPQPLRTVNGYIVRNGSPTFLFADENYSILVLDKYQRQVYFVPDAQLIGNSAAASLADLANGLDPTKGAALIGFNQTNIASFINFSLNRVVVSIDNLREVDKTYYRHVFCTGYYLEADGGGGHYWQDTSDTSSPDNGGTVIISNDGARWKLVHTGVVSVKQFGAKGDGSTDDASAINNAISSMPIGSTLFIPRGQYRVASTVTVTGGITLQGESRDSSTSTSGCAIVGDSGVSPIMRTVGATTTACPTLKSFSITRSGATPAANIIGLETTATDQQVIEDINLWNHGIGVYVHGQLSPYFHRVNTWKCSGYHVKIEATVEPTFYKCRLGRNGNPDVASIGYVNIVGSGVDTVRFESCQLNQSGATTGVIVQFTNYSNPNGIVTFIDSHCENWSVAGFAADGGTTRMQRLKLVGSSLHQATPGLELLSAAAGVFDELIISSCSIDANITMDDLDKIAITSCIWSGTSFLVNKGTGAIVGNVLAIPVIAQGVFNHFAFAANSMPNGFNFGSASGTFSSTGANI